MKTYPVLVVALLLCLLAIGVSGCAANSPGRADIDSIILSTINGIKAIDNHAHPVRFVGSGEPDREFDALPVDNMEPASDPLQLRTDDPGVLEAWRALWNYPYADTSAQHISEWKTQKLRIMKEQAENYPAWDHDTAGIDKMV